MSEAFAVEVNDRDFVNSLARGLEVIRVFTRHKPRMTLSEVAQSTDMTRATVRRFLLTLVREGYVETDGKYFSLRPKVLELGFSVLSSMNIWDVAQPIMNELSSQLQESCFAAILDHDSVIYVARANSNRLVNVGINIGSLAVFTARSLRSDAGASTAGVMSFTTLDRSRSAPSASMSPGFSAPNRP